MTRDALPRRGWGRSRSFAFSLVLHLVAAGAVAGTQGAWLVPVSGPDDRPLTITLAPRRPVEAEPPDELSRPDLVDDVLVTESDFVPVPTEVDESIGDVAGPALGVPDPDPSTLADVDGSIAETNALRPDFGRSARRVRAVIGGVGGNRDGVAARGSAGGSGAGDVADRAELPSGAPAGMGIAPAATANPVSPIVHREAPRYPARAVHLGLEGSVVLMAIVRADGALESLTVATSSGHDELDAAALDCVRTRWTFAAAPDSSGARVRRIEIPIRFQLRSASSKDA